MALNEVLVQIVVEDVGTFIQEGTVGAVLGKDVYMFNKISGKNEGISGIESAETNTDKEVTTQENADDTKEMKEETSGQTVEKVEDLGYNTTKSKETLEEVEKIEDNGGVEGGLEPKVTPSRLADNVLDADFLKNANAIKDKLPT